MTAVELWEKACELIKAEMNEISYNTWIKTGLEPVRLERGTMVLCVKAGYMKAMIAGRYASLIANCLSQAAGQPIQVQIITPEERPGEGESAGSPVEAHDLQLNPRYTFDTFVVGNNNRFAHAASLAVAESPAEAYNPLFIYGGSGLGKTHLMHAIGHYIQDNHPTLRPLYITSEDFTNELIAAIQQGRNQEFRNTFRNVDVLMVDDIQFIAGRNSTQEEFFHTFNALHSAGKQIILTSDKPPKDIALLEDRLRSRFSWGLTTDITRPDLDTRIAILRNKAKSDMIQVEDQVLELIASRVDNNIRELEGSLNKLVAYANLEHRPISVSLCEEALKDIIHTDTRRITADVVISTVADYYGISAQDIIGGSRRREVTVPRQIAMYLSRDMANLSLPQIGQAFGGRDHSTVLYSCNLVQHNIRQSAETASLIEDLRRMVLEGK